MMPELLDLLHSLGAWSLQALWLPILAWTLSALVALVLLRPWSLHPLVEYRLQQALLFALPLGLALTAAEAPLFSFFEPLEKTAALVELSPFTLTPVGENSRMLSWTLWHSLGLITLTAFLLAAWRLERFARSTARLAGRRAGHTVSTPMEDFAARMARSLNVQRRFRLVHTSPGAAPMTLGPLRPVIALPPDLRDEPLQMALAHELIHVRRRDDQAAWIEALLGALFAVHPLVAHLRSLIAETREQACDATLLQQHALSPRRYARLLYSFAVPPPGQPLVLSLAQSFSPLKNRLRAMNRLPAPPSRRTPLVLAVALLLVTVIGLAACSDSITPDDAPSAATPDAATAVHEAPAPRDVMPFADVQEKPSLKGGQQALFEAISYPESARATGLEGTVHVQFLVTKKGEVAQAKVLRGPDEILNRAALQAVNAQRFEPARQDGKPVAVRMTYPIRFQL